MNKKIVKLVYSAVCIALAMVLPFLTAQIPQIGKALSPMHIPVFLCGFTCGWPWGLVVGIISPLLRSAVFGMPAIFPEAVAMAFELAAYGFLSGLLYKLFPKKAGYVYFTLILSMIGGRIVWGAARFVLSKFAGAQFSFAMFVAGGFTNAVPGIILHLAIVPLIVFALKKADLMLNN